MEPPERPWFQLRKHIVQCQKIVKKSEEHTFTGNARSRGGIQILRNLCRFPEVSHLGYRYPVPCQSHNDQLGWLALQGGATSFLSMGHINLFQCRKSSRLWLLMLKEVSFQG